jgi:hypothetical protein
VQQAIEHICGFAQAAGNDLGMEHAVLIRDMGIDGHGLIVIPEVAWIEGAQEGTRLEPEALPIGRGHGAIASHGAQGQVVMIVDQDGIGGGEGLLPQTPL